MLFSFLYQNVLRRILFVFPPDEIHIFFTKIGKMLGKNRFLKNFIKKIFYFEDPILSQKDLFGLTFDNPVGLSAGFDKNADMINIMGEIGFSFIEVGTITFKEYKGNIKPWTYRLPKSKGIVVNYGLKNEGVEKITKKIMGCQKSNVKICISVGKTNAEYTKEDEDGINDYYECLKYINENNIGDFYSINISCPNTFGGEPFTTGDKLDKLLAKLTTISLKKPTFLKMPINLPWEEFKLLCEIAIKYNISGVIIGNLNKDKGDPTILDTIPDHVNGNISGKPTEKLSNELIFSTYKEFGDKLLLIGVGGVFCGIDAYEKIKRGASLVALVTGMIYQGPQLIGQINKELVTLLKKDGFDNIKQAIGSYHKG